jgi:chemotaxis protein methyltransferase CheR
MVSASASPVPMADPEPVEVGRAFTLSPEEFRRLSRLVHSESGIRLTEAKHSLVVSRLSRRLRILGLEGFAQYCTLVEGASGAEERGQMISSLTTNVTRFFREEHHFNQLREKVLPGLIARARAGGRVRLWSAGCSTGEEPYSLAFTLLDLCPDAASLDLRILATDIDPQVIETAQRGTYPAQSANSVPTPLRSRFLRPVDTAGTTLEVDQTVRSLISYRELNLLSRWPFRGQFDVIMCRNVVIYFDNATQEILWQRFAGALPPGGYLFIGHSERLSPDAAAQFQSAGVTSYVRTKRAAHAPGEAACTHTPPGGGPSPGAAGDPASAGKGGAKWG